jgi:hypothetical protein
LKNTLDLKLPENDAGADTVRDYLKALLLKLWEEEEGFSGKRPFGNSGWKHELIGPVSDETGTSHYGAEILIINAIYELE